MVNCITVYESINKYDLYFLKIPVFVYPKHVDPFEVLNLGSCALTPELLSLYTVLGGFL